MDEAGELQKKRRYAESIPPAKQALAIRERVLGPEHLETAAALDLLGRGYRLACDFSRAESIIQRALAIREKILGPEHSDTASSLNNLAALYYSTYALSKAEPLYQRALAIRKSTLGLANPDTAVSQNNLALLYTAKGDYRQAEALYQQALTTEEKLLGPDSLHVADTLTNLAWLKSELGANVQAESLLERALAINEKGLGAEHAEFAYTLDHRAQQYELTGALSLAESLYHRALAIQEKILPPDHPDLSLTLRKLGHVYVRLGAYARAEALYSRALVIKEKAFGLGNVEYSNVLNDLGELHLATGEFQKAERLLTRALAIRQTVLSRHESTATTLNNLANAYAHTGDDAESELLFRRALAMRKSVLGPTHSAVAASFATLATFYWAHGEIAKAWPLFTRAQALQGQNSEGFLSSVSEFRKEAYLQSLTEHTYKYATFSVAAPSRESASLGLSSILQYKGRALDAMSDSVSRLRDSLRSEDRARFEELSEIANQLSILAYRNADTSSPNISRQFIDELNARREKLEAELSARSSEFRKQTTPVTTANVQRAMPPNAALIEWFRYVPFDPKSMLSSKAPAPPPPARYVAFVLKHEGAPIAVDMGDAASIEAEVHTFRVAASVSSHDIEQSTAILSGRLFRPLRPLLHGVDQLLISPDGLLNLLPFAALRDDRGAYLAQRFELSYVTSGRDLLRVDEGARRHTSPLVVADPDFGNPSTLIAQDTQSLRMQRSADLDRSGLIFKPLANTELEAQSLQALLRLGADNVLVGGAATESRLKQTHSPRILHVASHGFFLSDRDLAEDAKKRGMQEPLVSVAENPLLRSGIALSGANARRSGEHEDGILTALEASQLDLHGTELVVLSACDSGVGDVRNGEGVYGLRRALVLAGAQTQVTSLWKISDEATRKLMTDYYRHLLDGEGRSAALQHAQLDMLSDPQHSHPYYWASFVVVGNWKPLPTH